MRFVTYRAADGTDRAGVVAGEDVHAFPPGVRLVDLLGDLDAAGAAAMREPYETVRLDAVTLRAPVPDPPTVRDFYAFEQHVRTARQRRGLEMDPDWYALPVFYFSNPYAVTGPGPVRRAPGTEEWDYELEVAAVLGRGGRDLTPDEGEAAIAGFCVMNDWSARDLQRREMKLSMGPVKGKDTATGLGPYLVSASEVAGARRGKAYDLAMTATVNGAPYSKASLADIHWSFGEMIAYASRGTEVRPGDVIGSGTCGTGCILELSMVHGVEAYPWLRPGDVVELSVEGLGTLTNTVVA